MSKKLYALLVGIDDYPHPVPKLYGCVRDVNYLYEFLKKNFRDRLEVEILKDSDASRENIIKMFRQHLGKAGQEDVAFFHYSGHGSRELSAPRFKEFFPESRDETLVCHDSRKSGGLDLADKELAVLLWEVAKKNPHLAVSLDCCHSGSGTRTADDFKLAAVRKTGEWQPGYPRPMETYLDGYYEKMDTIYIPKSKHILMAACDRTQTAKETYDRRGVFSTASMDVLARTGPGISYADLFVRCRSSVLKMANDQTPQFETYQRFMPYTKFLDGERLGEARRYHVYYEANRWQMDCGALHGLPTEAGKKTEVALYPLDGGDSARGHGKTVRVGAQKSSLNLDFRADRKDRFNAEITGLPVPPVPVYLEGDDAGKKRLKEALKPGANFALVDEPGTSWYVMTVRGERILLKNRETGVLIQGAQGKMQACVDYMLEVMEKVIRWEHTLALQNHSTTFYPENIKLNLFEILDDGTEHKYEGDDITVDLEKEGGEWKKIRAKLRVRNFSSQKLHFALVYLSEEYGIYILKNDPLPVGSQWVTLWGDGDTDYFYLPEEANEAVDTFKLIVSTEKVDDFLLVQDGLQLGQIITLRGLRAIGTIGNVNKLVTDDWFTKTITVRTVRQVRRAAGTDLSLADGQVTIKGHPSFRANVGLIGGQSHTRGADHNVVSRVLEGDGMQMFRFASTRSGGDNESFIELTDIRNPESLEENPLEIQLNARLEEGEHILPLTFDGTHFLPIGQAHLDENREVTVKIHHIPDNIDENRRSLGLALKLCFFKLALGRRDIRQLRWVEYQPDGTVVRHEEGVREKVAQAENIILLIHGIIGDTEPIAKGLPLVVDTEGKSLLNKYDLVLTYDYENLNTPIEETARHLKKMLKEVGIHEKQDKKITILAHSMGGLVARWFIEQEGGNEVVKHLVMAGTPNNGSAFGGLPEYRNLATNLLALSLNFFKPLILFAGGLLIALNESKKVTHTLEQMNEKSGFLLQLNDSGDPGVVYSILSGDITDYEVDEEGFFKRLMEKITTGVGKLVYWDSPNDIAVSVESIVKIDDFRKPAPRKIDLVCHHLNYFTEAVSLDALARVL